MIQITQAMRTTWSFLTRCVTPQGAAGIMGNLYAESGVIPNRVEILCLKRLKEHGQIYTDASYTAAVDDGKISKAAFLNPLPGKQYGYGLAQWTSPGRKAGLYDWCGVKGVSIGDLNAQLEFLLSELKTSYKGVWTSVKSASDIYSATVKVLMDYEQPGDVSQSVKDTRYGYAKDIYDQLKDKDMSKTDKALQWMLDTAADQRHGYSQQSRWGPDYDCSSAVITAWQNAGVPVKTAGATYTGNMKKPFLDNGFKDVTASCNLQTGAGMKPGDVLLNEYGRGTSGNGHAAMYAGNGQMVHARGQSYGSPATGDQGSEFSVTPYRNHPFDCVLRYDEGLNTEPLYIGKITHKAAVRTWAGTSYPKIKTYPTVEKGRQVGVCATVKASKGTPWYYCRIDGNKGVVYGFICGKWVTK